MSKRTYDELLNEPLSTIVRPTKISGSLPGYFESRDRNRENDVVELFMLKKDIKKSVKNIFEDYSSLGQLAPDEELLSDYWKAKINYFSHPRIRMIDPPQYEEVRTPYFGKFHKARKFIDVIHSQIDFSKSELHRQENIKNEDLEEILQAITSHTDLDTRLGQLGYDTFGM